MCGRVLFRGSSTGHPPSSLSRWPRVGFALSQLQVRRMRCWDGGTVLSRRVHAQPSLAIPSSSSLVRLMIACKTAPPPPLELPIHYTKWCMHDGNCGFLRFCAHVPSYHLVIVSIRARTSPDTHEIYPVPKGRGVKGTWTQPRCSPGP